MYLRPCYPVGEFSHHGEFFATVPDEDDHILPLYQVDNEDDHIYMQFTSGGVVSWELSTQLLIYTITHNTLYVSPSLTETESVRSVDRYG